MKQFLIITFLYLIPGKGIAQVNFSDSLGTITVQQDNRIVMLGEKMAEYNKNLATQTKAFKRVSFNAFKHQ